MYISTIYTFKNSHKKQIFTKIYKYTYEKKFAKKIVPHSTSKTLCRLPYVFYVNFLPVMAAQHYHFRNLLGHFEPAHFHYFQSVLPPAFLPLFHHCFCNCHFLKMSIFKENRSENVACLRQPQLRTWGLQLSQAAVPNRVC